MNCVVLLPNEVNDEGLAVLSGNRALHLIKRHSLTAGLRVRAAILDKGLGYLDVLSVDYSEELITVKALCEEEPPARLPIDLIVAVPRPQTIKKLLHLAASTGLRSLTFVGSEKGEKSYLHSKMLRDPSLHDELLLGIEQACDARVPVVRVAPSIAQLLKEQPLSLDSDATLRIVADTGAARLFSESVSKEKITSFVLTIGAESGWSCRELKLLVGAGFHEVSLGSRMLRVELAAHSLIAQAQFVLT
jgi:RsmE family RNA methyltransferase